MISSDWVKQKEERDAFYKMVHDEANMFHDRQRRAMHLEKARRKWFRKLVDETRGSCAHAWTMEVESTEILVEYLTDRKANPSIYDSAAVMFRVADRLVAAKKWLEELRGMS